MLRNEPIQSLAHHIGERPALRKGDRAERFMLLGLDSREKGHRLRKLLVSGPSASACRAGSRNAFSLHR